MMENKINKDNIEKEILRSILNTIANLDIELQLPPKEPTNLLEWWEINKVDGFSFNTFETGGEKTHCLYKDITLIMTIYDNWDLTKQINWVKQCLEVYK